MSALPAFVLMTCTGLNPIACHLEPFDGEQKLCVAEKVALLSGSEADNTAKTMVISFREDGSGGWDEVNCDEEKQPPVYKTVPVRGRP